jgi:WD40 repeat protein/serine/threonine protein kinase
MPPDSNREREIFGEALELGSLEEQRAFVKGACGGDEALRQAVEALLEAYRQAGGFIPDRSAEPGQMPGGPAFAEAVGSLVGRYKLLEKIGEGGCGVVYVAEQQEPVRRRVALKVIKLGMDTRQVVARFEAERQALALMDHPNIARVLDAGATETGRPFFVMELVRGIKITDYCDERQLSTTERLDLFVQVCRAVQHAHQKGIIHRDLKPSNILVTVNDGIAVPKVIDFGIAKAIEGRLTDKTVYTELHQFIGTPAYMSPEQAEMTSVDIDTRSDIYSLGVLLYELLTGKPPFDHQELMKAGLDAMRQTIREKEPPRPSTRLSTLAAAELSTVAKARRSEPPSLVHSVRGDLDWIVMKCLEKDRARRYDTANGLARDIGRHLDHEPVVARPPSRVYEFQKTLRRHWIGFAAAAAVFATLTLGVGVSSLEAVRAWRAERKQFLSRQAAQTAEKREAEQRRSAERLYYDADMNLAQRAWQQNQGWRVLQLLDETATNTERGFEWYYWQRQTHLELKNLRGHTESVFCVAVSPDGRTIATGGGDWTAVLWDAATGQERLTLAGHRGAVTSVSFSADSDRLLTSSRDGTARVWDVVTGKTLLTLAGHSGQIASAAFSPDGRRIATGNDYRTVSIWDATSAGELLILKGHTGRIWSVAFSPDGQRIVTGSEDHTARVWDSASGKELFPLEGHADQVSGVAVSLDGRLIATTSYDKTARLWLASTGQELFTLTGHTGRLWPVAFSPDGRRVATGAEDGLVKVWDTASGQQLFSLLGHRDNVNGLAFFPDGSRIVSASGDQTVKVWDATSDNGPRTIGVHDETVLGVAFFPDGQRIVTSCLDATAKVWDARTGRLLHTLTGHLRPFRGLAVSPDGRLIATGSGDQTVILWDADTGKALRRLTGHKWPLRSLSFSPDSRRLVTASLDRTARIWDVSTGQELRKLEGHADGVYSVAFSPDGQRVVTGSFDSTAMVWDPATGRVLLSFTGHSGPIGAAAFSLDGQRIATGADDRTAMIWDATTGKRLSILRAHRDAVDSVTFAPDGKRILTTSADNTAKLWDAISGKELLTMYGHTKEVWSAAFSPDGQRIVTASADHTAKLWDTATALQVESWHKEEQEASKRLAALRQERAAADERERAAWAQDPGRIRQWLVLAPISSKARNGVAALAREQIPDEAHLHPRVGDRIQLGDTKWSWRAFELDDYRINFNQLSTSPDEVVAYAVCYIQSEAAKTNLSIMIGSVNQARLYLNGQDLYRCEEPRRFVLDQDVISGVGLKQGLNVLVFKAVIEPAFDAWEGSIRFTDSAGQPVKGIRATITPALDQNLGAISQWLVLAPIPFEGRDGAKALAREQIPDEAHLRPRPGDRARVGGTERVWQELRLADYALDFNELLQTNADWSVAYAVCYIENDTAQSDLLMKVGSDDQARVYLNGQEIYHYEKGRAFEPDEDEVSGVEMKAGINVLVFKVVNQLGEWHGSVRLTDTAGEPVKGLRVTLTPPAH